MLVLLVEYIFLTTIYGLYFNHQLHITLYNFLKFLHVSWWISVGSFFHVLYLHLSFWLVGTTKLYSLQALLLSYDPWILIAYQPYVRAPTLDVFEFELYKKLSLAGIPTADLRHAKQVCYQLSHPAWVNL